MRTWHAIAALAAFLLAAVALPAWIAAQEGSGGRSRETGTTGTTRVTREFEVVARRFTFEPAMLEVNVGDTVKITLTSADGTHGFAIEKLDVKQTIRRGGEATTVEFVADRAGRFDIKCSEYCGSGHNRMKGVLVVRP